MTPFDALIFLKHLQDKLKKRWINGNY
jgi:hypothetical protein